MFKLFAFIIGLAIGSFLNVVCDRVAQGESMSAILRRSRSVCNHCQRSLSWYELIPLVSFIVLQGHCRRCHKSIPWRYPLVELATGLVVAVSVVKGDFIAIPLLLVLVALAVVDGLTKQVPDDGLAIALLLSAITLIAALPSTEQLSQHFLGVVFAAAALSPFVFIARGKLMGEADLLLAISLGLWLGFPAILGAVMLSFVIGGVVGLALVIVGLKKRTDTIGFVPFLVIGSVITYFFGDRILNWYL